MGNVRYVDENGRILLFWKVGGWCVGDVGGMLFRETRGTKEEMVREIARSLGYQSVVRTLDGSCCKSMRKRADIYIYIHKYML